MSLKGKIMNELKKDILSLQLKPGTIISETMLSERYHISRTPIREILKQLAREDYINVYPKKGNIVSYIDLESVEQVVYLRSSLEKSITHDLSQNLSLKGSHELQLNLAAQKECINEEANLDKFFQLDDDFHKTLYRLAGRQSLWDIIQQFSVHYTRYRKLHLLNKEKLIKIQQEHELLVTFIANGEEQKAEELLYHHLHDDINSINLPEHFSGLIKE